MSALPKSLSDPRGRWQGFTTFDGLVVQGCELDGFHIQRDGIVKASYYQGEAGTCPTAALAQYRDHVRIEREQARRAMGQE